jgi:hypothetical protein
MNALMITAITDLVLAGEVFFLAGMLARNPKERFSAAWFWSWSMTLLGLAALLGGIDHGLIEPQGMPRFLIQRSTWIVLGATTFLILMTAAAQGFPRRFFPYFVLAGIIQLMVNTAAGLLMDSFLVVSLNYMPVMVLWLGMNFAGLKKGSGSSDMIAGILILFLGTIIQAMQVDMLSPLDHNGLYHLISMAGMVFLYRGGRHLRPVRSER